MQSLRSAPAHLNALAEYLRTELGCPEHWVEVQADEVNGYIVGIALDVTLEETGDAESGPHMSMSVNRWVEVTPDYDLLVYDLSDVDWEEMTGPEDLPKPIRLTMQTLHVEEVEEVAKVAKYIVRLFNAFGVRQEVSS